MTVLKFPRKPSFLQAAKDVIAAEAKALQNLEQSLDTRIDQALEIIANTKGRLIVSGIGKSGHIGRKIAATFASTGQPSFFVHPAEAGHGDLGMIGQQDSVLLISYSGEAKELGSILDYSHRFSLPIISITGKADSTLARFSTLALILPPLTEACPMGLAPTTSTTLTLALGDALAVALLSWRGFSKHQFRVFHPGGTLGHHLKRVQDCMHQGDAIPLLPSQTLMSEALVRMTGYGFGCVGIVNPQQQLLGIITDGDLRRHMTPDLLTKTVDQVMTTTPVILLQNSLLADALALFEEKSITSLFVVKEEDQTVCGIIRLQDYLKKNV